MLRIQNGDNSLATSSTGSLRRKTGEAAHRSALCCRHAIKSVAAWKSIPKFQPCHYNTSHSHPILIQCYLPEGRFPETSSGAASNWKCPASCFGAHTLGNICYTQRRLYTETRPTTDELSRISSRRRLRIGRPASGATAARSLRPPGLTAAASEFRPCQH